MNARFVNLLLSGVTLGLLGVVGYLVYLLKYSPVPIRYLTRTELVTNKVTQISVRKVNATNELAGLVNRPTSWGALESANYPVYIENLRQFGCPEETIRDIIIADVAKLYAARYAALRARLPRAPYWQSPEAFASTSPAYLAVQKQIQDLDQEEHDLIKKLLSVDLQTELAKFSRDREESQEPNYDFLPADKRDPVTSLLKKYEDAEASLYQRTHGVMLPEDEAALRKLQRQRDAELARLLKPEELLAYQLRYSTTAQNLRAQLGGFNASEEEFHKIFQLQKTYDDTLTQQFDPDGEKDADIRARAG